MYQPPADRSPLGESHRRSSMTQHFRFHEETAGFVHAAPERVFATLDDHARLAAHMEKPSWRMGWARMKITTDTTRPRGIGSHLTLLGRVFGFQLSVDEVVTRYEPPLVKQWETTREPRLLVIGAYRMTYAITAAADGVSELRVTIDYNRPVSLVSRLLSVLFGRAYARWCTGQMVADAIRLGESSLAG